MRTLGSIVRAAISFACLYERRWLFACVCVFVCQCVRAHACVRVRRAPSCTPHAISYYVSSVQRLCWCSPDRQCWRARARLGIHAWARWRIRARTGVGSSSCQLAPSACVLVAWRGAAGGRYDSACVCGRESRALRLARCVSRATGQAAARAPAELRLVCGCACFVARASVVQREGPSPWKTQSVRHGTRSSIRTRRV